MRENGVKNWVFSERDFLKLKSPVFNWFWNIWLGPDIAGNNSIFCCELWYRGSKLCTKLKTGLFANTGNIIKSGFLNKKIQLSHFLTIVDTHAMKERMTMRRKVAARMISVLSSPWPWLRSSSRVLGSASSYKPSSRTPAPALRSCRFDPKILMK